MLYLEKSICIGGAWKAVPGRDNAASFQTEPAIIFHRGAQEFKVFLRQETSAKKCAASLFWHGLISIALGE